MISIKGELAEYIKKRNDRTDKDWETLDKLIWEKFSTESAILISDSSQFSLKTRENGIVHYLALILRSHDMLFPFIEKFGGEMLKAEADNIMASFPDVKSAVEAAVEMNRVLAEYNDAVEDNEEYNICIGIGFGRILRCENELFGNEVNIAFQLGEDIAGRNEILLTGSAKEQLGNDNEFKIVHYKKIQYSGFEEDSYELKY